MTNKYAKAVELESKEIDNVSGDNFIDYKRPELLPTFNVEEWCGFGHGESTNDYCAQGGHD